MKRSLLCLLALVLLWSTAALAADPAVGAAGGAVPNLVGKYSGKVEMHFKDKGFKTSQDTMVFEILEQQGHVFHGRKSWNHVGEKGEETFSGVISYDGSYAYVAEHEDGQAIIDIVDGGKTLYLYYTEGGKRPVAIYFELKRQK